MEKNTTINNATTPQLETLAAIIPQIRAENKLIQANLIATNSFFLPQIEPKKLYTVVGMTNSGKTWWSLGTAISLAREGKTVGYITTEDTRNDLVSYLGRMDAADELFSRIKLVYIEELTAQEFKNLFSLMEVEGCSVVILDYLRADILKGHSGDLNHTMGELYKVIRGQLEILNISVISLIQANASLYSKDLGALVNSNVNSLFTMIDGGYTTSKRSHFVGLLVANSSGNRGIMVLKAKFPHNGAIGQVFSYGNVKEIDFSIRYKSGVSFSSFNAANKVSRI